MSDTNPLGSWAELVRRLDAARCAGRWSADAMLRDLTSVQQLQEWTTPGNPQRADEVLGALVRLAAGAGDEDAAVVVLHLLLPGARRLARRVRHLTPDPLSLVLGELAIQIRRFPIERRRRAHAANLLMDTQLWVWRELKPYRTDQAHAPELLVDPVEDRNQARLLDRSEPGPDRDELDIVDVLLWARRTGVIDAADLAVLVELEYAHEAPGVSAQCHVAHRYGWTVRTVQRRRDRALTALRAQTAAYLSA